jgi:hypothetical protein
MKNSEPIPMVEMKSDNLRPSKSTNPKMKIAVAITLDMARQGTTTTIQIGNVRTLTTP